MKPKIVSITIFSFFVASFSFAQSINDTYNFAKQQFLTGNYEQALTEYQRVAFFDSENKYTDVYQKIGDSFYALNQYNQAFKNFDIAARYTENDSLKTELIFKKVNCLFKQDNYIFALNELLGLTENTCPYLLNKYNLYMAISHFGIEEYDNSFIYFSKTLPENSVPELTEIFNGYERFRKRFNPGKIQTMSMIVPGLGQMYMGNIGSGLNSIVLVGVIATATIHIWQVYGVLDAFLSMSSWYYRYYSGGYRSAKNLAAAKIEHEKEQVYLTVLSLIQQNLNTVK